MSTPLAGLPPSPIAEAQPLAPDPASEHLAEVAQEFESLLLNMLMKAMRSSVPRSGLFGDDGRVEMYEGLRDEELAKVMAREGGLGIAPLIVKQFVGRESEGLQALNDAGRGLRAAEDSYRAYGGTAAQVTAVPPVGIRSIHEEEGR